MIDCTFGLFNLMAVCKTSIRYIIGLAVRGHIYFFIFKFFLTIIMWWINITQLSGAGVAN